MDEKQWVGMTLRSSMDAEEWFGELDCTLDEFFAAPENAFVRLNHVRWLEAQNEFDEPNLVRNQDGDPPLRHYIYLRKSDVSMIRPLRVPLRVTEESD
jgi:hypothetical protein